MPEDPFESGNAGVDEACDSVFLEADRAECGGEEGRGEDDGDDEKVRREEEGEEEREGEGGEEEKRAGDETEVIKETIGGDGEGEMSEE